jgi:hypothetical protein
MTSASTDSVVEARVALGQHLAGLRRAAGLTQHELAPDTFYGRSTLANVELGRQSVSRDFWVRCDEILASGGSLTAEYDRIRGLVRGSALVPAATGGGPAHLPAGGAVSLLALSAIDAVDDHPLSMWAPSGRFFPGVAIDAHIYPAVDDGRILTAVPSGYVDDPFLRRTGRGLVIGRVDGDNGPALFGLDAHRARRTLAGTAAGARLLIPRPYLLDDITFAVLWAVANLDEALLADDAVIADCDAALAGYATLTTSAASLDLAADLNPTGALFVGSAFCAGHIGRHATTLTDVPVFWTREQRGEHASTWLLFAHKNIYLRETADQFRTAGQRLVRAFCIPPDVVAGSPLGERALLLLAIELIESYDITVVVTDEPEFASLPGFVTDQRGRAIVANWVGADGIWQVDVTDRRATVYDFDDAARYARAHSVITANTSHQRLRMFAEYLDIDWAWLRLRCADLADTGVAGIARPRSRHLSVDGVDRACRYIAAAPVADS